MQMKAFISLITLVLFSMFTMAQTPVVSKKYSDADVEKMVQTYKSSKNKDIYPASNFQQQFSKDFPNAKDIDWETAANIYEVDFEFDRIDYKAYYDSNANLVMYTVDVGEYDMPAIVKNAAMAKYPNYKFDDIKKIVKGSETFYEVEMEKSRDKEVKATFRTNGTFIKEIYNR